jgi:hypothetical protein
MSNKGKVFFVDSNLDQEKLEKSEQNDGWFTENPLAKSLIASLRGKQKAQAIAFSEDPQESRYHSLYIDKNNTPLLPDTIIKRTSYIDDLIAAIVRGRANHISSFGTMLPDRKSMGYRLDPEKNSNFDKLPFEKKAELIKESIRVSKLLASCGNLEGLDDRQKQTFSEFLYVSAANAVRFGRITTELIKDSGGKFCGFRAVDPSTIYFARKNSTSTSAKVLREQAFKLLQEIKKETVIDPQKYANDEYAFIQVINGTPRHAFTDDEMVNFNFYPTTDFETNHYPITPIDTVINAIITHVNITQHNKLYFQSGRATRGMLVIQSESVNDSTLEQLKQQFQASINGVQNSWRVPVISVGTNDKVSWQSIDGQGRDMEFQYLFDSNIRIILAAFNMSPDELPGYNHLSKGTNNQSLSESNNEYKLQAARDVGIRPLLSTMETFINLKLIPLFNPELSRYFKFKFYGLDAETPEKEASRIEAEQKLWGTMNDTLRSVEKEEIPAHLGGDFPLNPVYQAVIFQCLTMGEILEHFFKKEGASKDKRWDYVRDNFYFQHISMIQQQEMAQQQQQMAQQAAAQQAQGQPQQGQEGQQQQQQGAPQQQQPQGDPDAQKLQTGIDQLINTLSKSEAFKSSVRAQQERIVESILEEFEKGLDDLIKD